VSATLESHFEKIVGVVRAALASGKQSCYFPTLVAIEDEKLTINSLFRGLPDTDILRAVESFGFRCGRRKHVPEFLFFSAESLSSDARDQVMVTGCSKDFQMIVGYLELSRTVEGHLIPGVVSGVGYPGIHDSHRVPAWHAMNGVIAKSKAPWWRL
jgi:hypothetical protein